LPETALHVTFDAVTNSRVWCTVFTASVQRLLVACNIDRFQRLMLVPNMRDYYK